MNSKKLLEIKKEFMAGLKALENVFNSRISRIRKKKDEEQIMEIRKSLKVQ